MKNIGLSSTKTSKLQSILNAAARLIGGIAKFDHNLLFYRRLPSLVPHPPAHPIRGLFPQAKLLDGSAPHYLMALCNPVSSLCLYFF